MINLWNKFSTKTSITFVITILLHFLHFAVQEHFAESLICVRGFEMSPKKPYENKIIIILNPNNAYMYSLAKQGLKKNYGITRISGSSTIFIFANVNFH